MKILHTVHRWDAAPTGGTERAVHALAAAQAAAGHDVLVVAGSLEPGAPDAPVEVQPPAGGPALRVLELRRDDLHFEQWWKLWHPGVSAAFERLVRVERPDLVHVHHWLRLSTDLVRAARRAGATVAVTVHDHFPVLGRAPRLVGEEAAAPGPVPFGFLAADEIREAFALLRDDFVDELRAADVRFAPSAAHAASIAELAPQPTGPFEVVPVPLLDLPRRVARTAGTGDRRLIAWGSWYAEKGLDTVLQAIRLAGTAAPERPWRLDLLGEAADPGTAEALRAAREGLDVVVHGRFDRALLEDVAGRAPGGLAVLPTRCRESYGMTLDEARALGLPVVAADVPAFRERADAGATLWFEPGDAVGLARLLTGLGDGSLRAGLWSPPPPPASAEEVAARTMECVAEAMRRSATVVAAPLVDGGRRSRQLWRAAERRFWSLAHGGQAAPDGYLGADDC